VNPGLLFPAGLLALAGLLVPLLIHLVRRSELVVHDFAALRWLSARARPRRAHSCTGASPMSSPPKRMLPAPGR